MRKCFFNVLSSPVLYQLNTPPKMFLLLLNRLKASDNILVAASWEICPHAARAMLAPQMIVARPFAQLFPPTVSNSTSMIYMTAHLRLPPSLYIRRDCTSDCGQILRVYTTCETTITAVPFMRDYTRKVRWLWYSRGPPLHPTPSHIQACKKMWNNSGIRNISQPSSISCSG